MLVRIWRKRKPFALLVGKQTGGAPLDNSLEVPQKLKIELPYDPATELLGIDPKDTGVLIQSGHNIYIDRYRYIYLYISI